MLSMPQVRSLSKNQQQSKTQIFGLNNDQLEIFFPITDLVFFAYFLFDIVVRFITCPDKSTFKKLVNIIDVASIIIFFLLFFLNTQDKLKSLEVDKVRRAIESTRALLALHSLSLVSWRFQAVLKVLGKSYKEILLIIFCLAMLLLFISTVVFYAEVDKNDQFTSIPVTFWWAIVTTTTVGYGQMLPVSLLGRLFSGIISLLGPFVIAMFVAIFGKNFSDIYMKGERKHKMIKAYGNSCRGYSNSDELDFE